MSVIVALGTAALVAGLAVFARALSGSGALAAVVVGTMVLGATGWPGGVVLGVYFVTSTAIGRLAAPPRSGSGSESAGAERRGARQVLANGGPAALGAPLELVVPGLGLWIVTVSLAAAAADTWATGFGALSPRPPRDIVRRQRVPAGTSGAVSWLGTSGGAMGAAVTALAGASVFSGSAAALYGAATVLGVAGMLVDSVLGSVAQARFHCPVCDTPTERATHCGRGAQHRRGWVWLDNDAVNALATMFAAGSAAAWWWLWPSR